MNGFENRKIASMKMRTMVIDMNRVEMHDGMKMSTERDSIYKIKRV